METLKQKKGGLLKEIALIAIPVACQNLLSTSGSMVDTMMLAKLGETTVSAVSMCAQFSSLFIFCYWGFVGGGTLFVSQYWGAGDDDGIRRSYGLSLCMLLLVGLLFGVLSTAFPQLVMGVYTDKPDIQAIGIRYLRIMGITFPLQSLIMALSMLLRTTERARIPLAGGVAAVLSNCFFNYILIFGKFGAPAMGVAGAAMGTVISNFLNLAVLLVCILVQKVPYALELRRCFGWSREFVSSYFRSSSLILINECGMGFGNMLINVVLGRQSAAAIAAIAIYRTLENMIWAFFTGFSSAGSVLVGKEVGAGRHEEAQRKTVFIVYLTSGFIFAVCCGMMLLHRPLFTLLGLSGESFAICRLLCYTYCIVAPIRLGGWQHTDCFRSGGDPLFGTVQGLSFQYLMVIPCVYIAHFVFRAPFYAVFLLSYCDEPIKYWMSQRHLYSRRWIRPVSEKGLETIDGFREKHNVKLENPLLDRIKTRIKNSKKDAF